MLQCTLQKKNTHLKIIFSNYVKFEIKSTLFEYFFQIALNFNQGNLKTSSLFQRKDRT